MIPRYMLQKVILIGIVFLLAGCGSAEPPIVGEIQAQPSTTILTGESASLTIPVSGTDLKFKWTVSRGSLSEPTLPSVIYTAPMSPGPDNVTVEVTSAGGTIIRSIPFQVVEPPPSPTPTATNTLIPTDTPMPTQTSTLTPTPEPIDCRSPAITKNVFPQLANESGQFPFYGPLTEPRFFCEGVYDIFHSEPLAVRIEYRNVGTNFGFWGIGTPNGYAATSYSEICLWAFAQKPNQSFRLKMRDTSKVEKGVILVIEEANQWKQICTDLVEFSGQGVHLDRLENVNLGFEQATSSAEVWVDDFEFK